VVLKGPSRSPLEPVNDELRGLHKAGAARVQSIVNSPPDPRDGDRRSISLVTTGNRASLPAAIMNHKSRSYVRKIGEEERRLPLSAVDSRLPGAGGGSGAG
jgi:hypothetical protein